MEERLRILLCEDDENLGMLLREYLQAKGYNADLFPDGESGYKAFLKGKYDLCVLDVMMPKKDGFALAQEIRTVNSEVPIIFLTAKSLKEDILEGFKIGADDYITKPFNPVEVIARVRSQLRRYMILGSAPVKRNVLAAGDITLDDMSREVCLMGEAVSLTPKEYGILKFLLENQGQVFSPAEIYSNVWKEDAFGAEGTVAVHIRHLREKLEIAPENPRHIKVVWGQGYKIE